jgi:hypothetical protein
MSFRRRSLLLIEGWIGNTHITHLASCAEGNGNPPA